jgi:hypothetical protein
MTRSNIKCAVCGDWIGYWFFGWKHHRSGSTRKYVGPPHKVPEARELTESRRSEGANMSLCQFIACIMNRAK